ncbi:MAG: hypothetical protein ACOX8V_04575 [Thermoleophilia bacterium]|jgi:hypothetical protein
MIKRTLPILLILIVALSVALSACGSNDTGQTTTVPDSSATPGTEKTFNLTLYADFSNGSPDGNIEKKQITLPIENEPASQSQIAFALADGLTEWTGLDFTLNDVSFPDDESISVDWSKDSTLIAGIGDREFKEGFHFYDAVSLNWFMMDSLATTLKGNMEIANVYYQSEAQPITFQNPEDMAQQGLPELPIDQPYEGSGFFVAHAGGKGEDDTSKKPSSDKESVSTTKPSEKPSEKPNEKSSDDDWIVNEPIAEGVIFKGSLLRSDPGENMPSDEAASGLYSLVLKNELTKGTDYSKEKPMYITCVDITNIDGYECYVLSVSGAFNTKAWEYAVDYNYDRQYVYLMSEAGNKSLGSLLDLGGAKATE